MAEVGRFRIELKLVVKMDCVPSCHGMLGGKLGMMLGISALAAACP